MAGHKVIFVGSIWHVFVQIDYCNYLTDKGLRTFQGFGGGGGI